MKNKYTLLALVVSSIGLNSSLFAAADGTINFTGTVVDTACVVTPEATVNLGTIAKGVFAAAGDTASPTTFTIELKSCPDTLTKANVRFDGAPAAGGLIALTKVEGVAGNIGLAIYESDNVTQVHMGKPSASVTLDSTKPNTLTYIAKYKAIDKAVTAGKANATANITIVYN